jgi:hypothetical protein
VRKKLLSINWLRRNFKKPTETVTIAIWYQPLHSEISSHVFFFNFCLLILRITGLESLDELVSTVASRVGIIPDQNKIQLLVTSISLWCLAADTIPIG